MVNYITSSKFTICMFDYTNLCEVNFKTRRTTYCSNIVLYSMNMFHTLYSIYNTYVHFILIFTNFKNEEKYLYIVQSLKVICSQYDHSIANTSKFTQQCSVVPHYYAVYWLPPASSAFAFARKCN